MFSSIVEKSDLGGGNQEIVFLVMGVAKSKGGKPGNSSSGNRSNNALNIPCQGGKPWIVFT